MQEQREEEIVDPVQERLKNIREEAAKPVKPEEKKDKRSQHSELSRVYRETGKEDIEILAEIAPPRINQNELIPMRGWNFQVKSIEGNQVLLQVAGPTAGLIKTSKERIKAYKKAKKKQEKENPNA